jgi:alpha-beta hydrolase superfamily lysophospholipase
MKRLLVTALILGACGGADPGVRATLPHPEVAGAVRSDLPLSGADGRALFAQRWLPDGAPRGVLVIVHGLKDHSDRYAPLVARVTAAGFAVYALDLRGHGRSSGARVDVGAFDDYVEDANRLLAIAQEQQPGLPTFVFGHSMGGVIVATLAETRRPAIQGVILSAPALGIDAPAFVAGLLGGLGSVPGLRRLALFEPKSAQFSSDREVVDDMNRDPLIHNAKAPVHTPAALLGAAGRAWDRAGALTVPIVILHGTADVLTAPASSRAFLRRVGTPDHTLKLYAGAWHDLVHEPQGDQIASDVIAWMEARFTGPTDAEPLPTGKLRGDRIGTMGRLALRGGYVTDPGGGDLEMSLGFAAGRTLMIGVAGEGRVDLGGDGNSAGTGVLQLGTRFGRAGWFAVGAGGGWLGGGGRAVAQADLALAPPGLPLALHLRATGFRAAGNHVESELTLRWPGDRTFWNRGRRGAGWTLGARTLDGDEALTILLGLEVSGFD